MAKCTTSISSWSSASPAGRRRTRASSFAASNSPDGHASGYQADLDQGAVWLGRIYDEHGRALLVERGARVSIAPDGRRWTDVFAEPKSFLPVIKAGDWNTYRITAKASHVEVRINDVLFSVLDDHEAKAAEWSGKIAFQLHSGPGPVEDPVPQHQLTDLGQDGDAGTRRSIQARDRSQSDGAGRHRAARAMTRSRSISALRPARSKAGRPKATRGKAAGQRRHRGAAQARQPAITRASSGSAATSSSATKARARSPRPSFTVTHPWASFLVGAGKDQGHRARGDRRGSHGQSDPERQRRRTGRTCSA